MCNADTFFTSVQWNVKGLEATVVDRSMTRRRSGLFTAESRHCQAMSGAAAC
jgi:hypothetical protein